MKPLQAVGLGLIIVILEARFPALRGWDAYFDPLGWLLVLYGVHRLPTELPRRNTVLLLAWLSAAASVPLSMPGVLTWLDDAEASLAWASNLPKFGFLALLCLALAEGATQRNATAWLSTVVTAIALVVVAPVLVFGAGWDWLAGTTGMAAQVVQIWAIWLFFTYSGREWAGASANEHANGPPEKGGPSR